MQKSNNQLLFLSLGCHSVTMCQDTVETCLFVKIPPSLESELVSIESTPSSKAAFYPSVCFVLPQNQYGNDNDVKNMKTSIKYKRYV